MTFCFAVFLLRSNLLEYQWLNHSYTTSHNTDIMPSNESGGSTSSSGPALKGIHVPSLTFFTTSDKQEIDWETQTKHLRFLISSGVHGIVLAGTNGEAITLSRAEKSDLVRATRQAARDLGKPELPICLGTSGTSTRDVLDDCVAAKDAGANFALVLVPSFFHFAMTKDAVCEFFKEVADASPVPIVIYNFPGVAAGLNVDSTMLDRLAKHANIVGVKVRCRLSCLKGRVNS
jgi:dihydrodipicolinate synthase/N-acetylneuraminate lyase